MAEYRRTPAILTDGDRVIVEAIVSGAVERGRLTLSGIVAGAPSWFCERGARGRLTYLVHPGLSEIARIAMDDVEITDYDEATGRIAFRGRGPLLTPRTGAYAGPMPKLR